MANDFDPAAFLKETAPASSSGGRGGGFDPQAFLKETAPKEERGGISEAVRPITTYLPTQKEMAHEGLEQIGRGIEQLKEPTGGDLAKSAKAALYGVGNVGFGALGYVSSPITAAYRTVVERPVAETTGSPLAGQLAGFAAQLATPGIGLTRMPGAKAAPEVPTSTFAERRAGREIERKASDIGKVKERLETEPTEIVPGSKQTTFEVTGDEGLGGLERKSRLRSPTPFVERAEERAGARLGALEGQQETGNVADAVEHVRQSRARGQWSIEQDVALADQRAREAAELPGGQYDPVTHGNVMRQELRNAEEVRRGQEEGFWQRADPNGVLRLDPQPLQQTERAIYGVMPEGGAAEGSLTAAERDLTRIIQNYPAQIPFQELRDFTSLLTTRMREELWTNGRSQAYARMSRLRQGVADAEENVVGALGQRDPDLAGRLREARTATRERAQDFGRGPVGDVLRREGSQGPFKVEPAQVNDKLLPVGNKGYDVASSYLRAAPDSLGVYTDALTGKMRREVLRPDGAVDPRKLEGFLRRHDGVLRAISERDGGAYAQSLRDVGQAQERLATTLERQRANTEAFESSELGKLIGAADNDHAINVVGNIFGRADRVDRARQLAQAVSASPDAQAGLRRAVQQYVRKTYVGNAEAAGGTPMIPPNAFMNFMKENETALRQIMLPEQVDAWKAIATEMGRTSRIAQTKTLPDSGTAQNLIMSLKDSWPWVAADMALSFATTGVPAPIGHAVHGVKGLLSHVKKNGITSTNRLVDEAMLNPEVARELLKAKGRPSSASVRLQQTAPGLLRTGTIRAATPSDEEQQKRAPRQAGGGVPAIGGTGGRSPGARETARAGAARSGAGQALQDGGEAREQQAAAPVGGRERFAAALQGTPTGAGFSGGSTQSRKAQPAKTPSREDIRRTLQSFGISGEQAGGFAERQLGEVDSRAEGGTVKRTKASVDYSKGMKASRCGICTHYSTDHKCELVQGYIGPGMWCELFKKKTAALAFGGGVDDPSGERAPIRYDPGDDTSFGARFGKWDKTSEGASVPAEEDDPDASVMVPGDKLINRSGRGERDKAGYYMTRGMADGGAAEDRWASLPSSQNIEDRRAEAPLSIGQLVAGNQAFMGKYPAPYTRAPRRAATVQARADGGEVGGELHQGLMPSTLLDETRKYVGEQLAGVEQEHEQQDPLEAAVKHSGAQKNPPSYGGSDEGKLPLPGAVMDAWEGPAARTRRRAPVREPDPASLAASQGKVGWGDVARHKLEQGVKTVTAPGRAYQHGMTPDEEIEAAQGMAGLMGGARFPGVAAGAAEGSLGIFGGMKSKTADLDMMHRAMEMRAKGVNPESIWNRTGWFRGPEGWWRYEIPDVEARVLPSDTIRPRTGWMGEEGMARPTLLKTGELRDIIEHPEFASAYPKLMGMPASMELGVKPGGGYLPPDFLLRNPGDVGSMEARAPRSKETFAGDVKEDLSEITPRRILLHEMQHAVQAAEDFASGGNPNALPFTDRQIANLAKKKAEAEGIPWASINSFDRQKIYRAMRHSLYEMLAGETEARNVERRRDISGYRPPPWKTEDIPRENQLVFSDPSLSYGFKPQKGQKPFTKVVPYAEGGGVAGDGQPPLPDAVMDHWGSEADAVQEAAERAALRQRRGVMGATTTQGTGRGEDKYPRSERDMPMLEALAPTSPLDYGMMVLGPWGRGLGLAAKSAILAGTGLLSSSDEAEAGAAGKLLRLGRGAPKGGGLYPGIYGNPAEIARHAESMVAPEHPALKELFGVTRQDLSDIGQQGRRAGNILDPQYGGMRANPKGSYVAEGVMTRGNEQRLLDALGEAQTKAPRLVQGMDAWYVMDPLYQRMVQLVGPEQALKDYRRFNTLGSMASPGSEVMTEINRGSAANMMAHQGQFPRFQQFAGMAEKKRGADFPPELRDVIGHPYHSTAQAGPMGRYLESGGVDMTSPKVPLYIQASGVPQTGFQTRLPVADAHFTRAIGAADVRAAQGHKHPGVSMKTPEYSQTGPWFRENVAKPIGIEAVPAQARLWGLMAPQTGVDTAIGAPKLELMAQAIWERAHKLGIDPKVFRDYVLRGAAHMNMGGVIGPGFS